MGKHGCRQPRTNLSGAKKVRRSSEGGFGLTAGKMDHDGKSQPALDEAALSRLLVLAGPKDAAELMRRLIKDISQLAEGISASLLTQDRAAMHKHSHVLLAISGTIGAQRVYELAQALNKCAKDENCTEALPEALEVPSRLQGLIARLRGLADERGIRV